MSMREEVGARLRLVYRPTPAIRRLCRHVQPRHTIHGRTI